MWGGGGLSWGACLRIPTVLPQGLRPTWAYLRLSMRGARDDGTWLTRSPVSPLHRWSPALTRGVADCRSRGTPSAMAGHKALVRSQTSGSAPPPQSDTRRESLRRIGGCPGLRLRVQGVIASKRIPRVDGPAPGEHRHVPGLAGPPHTHNAQRAVPVSVGEPRALRGVGCIGLQCTPMPPAPHRHRRIGTGSSNARAPNAVRAVEGAGAMQKPAAGDGEGLGPPLPSRTGALRGGGGGMRSPRLAKNAENAAKNAIENAVLLEWCMPLETPMFRLVLHPGAQSMDGLMEQLSAVVQLKNITD